MSTQDFRLIAALPEHVDLWMAMREEPACRRMLPLEPSTRESLLRRLLEATSDLGDNWNETLATHVDYVMANVHPVSECDGCSCGPIANVIQFFGGVTADQAASWTYTYWQGNDVAKTNNPPKQQVIAELGWPSEGGQYCTDSAVWSYSHFPSLKNDGPSRRSSE